MNCGFSAAKNHLNGLSFKHARSSLASSGMERSAAAAKAGHTQWKCTKSLHTVR